MGNCCQVEGAVDHWIYVKTGDKKGSIGDAHLMVTLEDDRNRKSPPIPLRIVFKPDWERGKTDVFQAPHLSGFSDIVCIEVCRTGPGGEMNADQYKQRDENGDEMPDWYCEVVIVNDRSTERCYYFPIQRWVRYGEKMMIEQNDTSLPQFDHHKERRDKEIEVLQERYQYGQSAPDLPVQVSNLPPDEQFSDEFKCDIMNAQYQLLSKGGIMRLPPQPWESLEELTNAYSTALPEPVYFKPAYRIEIVRGLPPQPWESLEELTNAYSTALPETVGIDRWSNDLCFGAQRLIGCNPTMVKLCTDLPENMGITAEMLRPFLEGWSMKQIIEAKRLFVVDLKILQGLTTKDNRRLCAPIGLFFVTGDKQFAPIAIQLYQDIKPDNPVFLPNDPPFTWLLAKMWFNNADAAVHQALSHFAYTHLLMESICVAFHRHLSPVHPIYRLLAPHFVFLPAINARGLDQLMTPGGWADKCTTLGREGMFELIRRGVEEWRMDVHGTFPKELESRGVLDSRVLPNYGYRDDAMLLYKAIETYVNKVVRYYYDILDKLKLDVELQSLARELSTHKEDGGAGIRGVPGQGRFRRVEDVTMFCTCVIFTCSVQHSAVNYPQYNEYAFPPQYPSVLGKAPPTDKSVRTEEDITSILPDKATTLEIMSITRLFSLRHSKCLGEWEFQSQYDPFAVRAEKEYEHSTNSFNPIWTLGRKRPNTFNEFKEELRNISMTINQRNKERESMLKYEYLNPTNIPGHIAV